MDMDEIRMILAVRALRKLLNKGERAMGMSSSLRIGR